MDPVPFCDRQRQHVGVNVICRNELGQALEPEAGCLGFGMPELPWLDDLIGLADFRADDTDGVFQRDALDRGIHKRPNEIESTTLPAICNLGREMPRSAHGQIGAWRMSDE